MGVIRNCKIVDFCGPLQLVNDFTPSQYEVEYLGHVCGAGTEFHHALRIAGEVYLANDYGDLAGHDLSFVRNKPPEPKLRPYTPQELRRLVGKKVKLKEIDSVFLINGFISKFGKVQVGHITHTAEELLAMFERANGGPCGVLEE